MASAVLGKPGRHQYRLTDPLPGPRDGDQPGDEPLERRGGLGDQLVQLGDLGGQVVVGVQVRQTAVILLRIRWWLLPCLGYIEQRAAYVGDVHYAD